MNRIISWLKRRIKKCDHKDRKEIMREKAGYRIDPDGFPCLVVHVRYKCNLCEKEFDKIGTDVF